FIKIPDHIPDLINKHPKKMYSGMLHAHKNRPHISALRNKDNQLFRIWVVPFFKDYLLIIVLSHPTGAGHLGQVGQ
ncbi:MAG: hypothetical protein PHS38_12450, partial [Bacteroidales bacterium]|nr:hypothetical protein [Bacteroidales bacterium]